MPDDENPSARAKPPIFLQDQRFAVPERGHEQLIPVLSGQRPAAANALLTAEEQRREGLRWLGQLRRRGVVALERAARWMPPRG